MESENPMRQVPWVGGRTGPEASDRAVGVPPPIPGQGFAPGLQAAAVVLAGRLHPLTLVFRAWHVMRGIFIPAIILLVVGRDRMTGVLLLLLTAVPLVMAILRYVTFTYRVEAGELVLRHGLLGRNERHIPFTRVQDIRIEQGLLHRVLGMADVEVDTAGGEGAEASLSVLSKSQADRLRAMVFEHRSTVTGASTSVPGAVAAPASAPAREVIRQLGLRDLVLAGLTSNKLASVLALVLVAERLSDNFLSEEARRNLLTSAVKTAEHWADQGPENAWGLFVLGGLALVLVGMAVSVVGSIVVFYGFTLSKAGEDLHRAYGLLTRRSSSLPRRRIQVLKVEEKLLRRLFRLATVRVDTAGKSAAAHREEKEGRDLLLPILPRSAVEQLLPEVFPGWDTDGAVWQRVSRRAIWRGTVKGALLCLLAAVWTVWDEPGMLGFWPLSFIPVVYVLNLLSYRHLGYGLGRHYFRTRRGWLGRATHVVPIRNAQVLTVRETPFDRRHGVATLIVDTAGQAYTGGGPRIGNVPVREAYILARLIAHGAASTAYRP